MLCTVCVCMCVMRATSLMQLPMCKCAGTMDCGLDLTSPVVSGCIRSCTVFTGVFLLVLVYMLIFCVDIFICSCRQCTDYLQHNLSCCGGCSSSYWHDCTCHWFPDWSSFVLLHRQVAGHIHHLVCRVMEVTLSQSC